MSVYVCGVYMCMSVCMFMWTLILFLNLFRKGRGCGHYLISQLEAGEFVLAGEHKVHRSLAQLLEYHMRVRCWEEPER